MLPRPSVPDPIDHPVPLVILTGFPGAGKTTVLNRVLAAQHHRRVAVLVNELGRIDIDAGLIRGRAGDVLELAGGCVCHQIGVQRELWSALHDIVQRARPDVVVLETTGLAEPDAILEGLEALRRGRGPDDDAFDAGGAGAFEAAATAPPVRVSAIVAVVDAEAGLRQLERHEEARAQIRAADRILLSKMDLATPTSDDGVVGATVAALHRRLHELNPIAERAAFPDGAAGTSDLIGWLLAPGHERGALALPRSARSGHHGHSAHQLAAASYVDDAPLVADALLLLCASLGDRLVRAKGHVHLAGESRRAFLDRSGERTRLDLGAPWGQERPSNRLVLIGEDLDEAALQRQLWACRAPGPGQR